MAPQIASKKLIQKNKQEEFYKTVNKKLRDLRITLKKMQNTLEIILYLKLDQSTMTKKM